jgi:hypothetical protein
MVYEPPKFILNILLHPEGPLLGQLLSIHRRHPTHDARRGLLADQLPQQVNILCPRHGRLQYQVELPVDGILKYLVLPKLNYGVCGLCNVLLWSVNTDFLCVPYLC